MAAVSRAKRDTTVARSSLANAASASSVSRAASCSAVIAGGIATSSSLDSFVSRVYSFRISLWEVLHLSLIISQVLLAPRTGSPLVLKHMSQVSLVRSVFRRGGAIGQAARLFDRPAMCCIIPLIGYRINDIHSR